MHAIRRWWNCFRDQHEWVIVWHYDIGNSDLLNCKYCLAQKVEWKGGS